MDDAEQFDDAMFDFSTGDYARAEAKFRDLLVRNPQHFDAQLALGMALYRQGNYDAAIAEGHKAEALKPKEQLVHTNLSLFYMRKGDKLTAEHHGLQARIAGWREEAQQSGTPPPENPELTMARPKLEPVRIQGKVPNMPWKKKKTDLQNPGNQQ